VKPHLSHLHRPWVERALVRIAVMTAAVVVLVAVLFTAWVSRSVGAGVIMACACAAALGIGCVLGRPR